MFMFYFLGLLYQIATAQFMVMRLGQARSGGAIIYLVNVPANWDMEVDDATVVLIQENT